MKKYIYVILILIVLICSYFFYEKEDDYEGKSIVQEIEKKQEKSFEEKINKVFVEIKGAVKEPDVYEVNESSRVIDIIKIAGGLKSNGDTSLINLSKKVYDEMTIIIYTKEQVKKAKSSINEKEIKTVEVIKILEKEKSCIDDINDACINNIKSDDIKENESSLININTASKENLMTLPGIGESKANAIIEYRNINKFNEISDITNVSGIGTSTFENLKEYISV